MRIIGLVLLASLLLYGAGVALLALFQRQLIYPGAFAPAFGRGNPARPPGTQAVAVATADGETLHGLWRPPEPGCGVVLTFHGNGSRPEPHAERFVGGPWRGAGWGTLAIAYRGYPGSTGSPSEDGLIRDGVAAYLAVAERAPGAPILLHGHSLGAAVATALAERAPHLGLYLEAPFNSLSHVVRLHYPFVPANLLRDTYRSDTRIRRSGEPILIVHGTHDPVVPAKLGLRLASAAGPSARFEAVVGDHVSILGSRDGQAEALFRARIGNGCEGASQVEAR